MGNKWLLHFTGLYRDENVLIDMCAHNWASINPEHLTFIQEMKFEHQPRCCPSPMWASSPPTKAQILSNSSSSFVPSAELLIEKCHNHWSRWLNLCCVTSINQNASHALIALYSVGYSFVLLKQAFFWDPWLSLYGPYQPHTLATAILTWPESW